MVKEESARLLAGALSRAREVSPKLSTATDKLNKALCAAEQAISDLQLGVRASVTMDEGPPTNPWFVELAFRKDGKAWRLFIVSGHLSHPDDDSLVPLTNATRDQRIQAVGLLPDLVHQLILSAESAIQRVEESIVDVKSFVATVVGEGTK